MGANARAEVPPLEIVLLDRQRRRRIDRSRLRAALEGAARALKVGGAVSLVLTGDRTVHRLNREYRGKDKPTDVLSFPGRDEHPPRAAGPGRRSMRTDADGCEHPPRAAGPGRRSMRTDADGCEHGNLGDIVISVETAARNARRLGRTLAQELDVLALHGFLHVLGYDHETDDGTMDRLEGRLRRRLLKA